jgi:hypothetical protein
VPFSPVRTMWNVGFRIVETSSAVDDEKVAL